MIIILQQQRKTKNQKVHISMCSRNTIIRYNQPCRGLNQTPFCILGNFSWLEATHQCISSGCNGHTLEKPYTRPCPSTPPWILYIHQPRAELAVVELRHRRLGTQILTETAYYDTDDGTVSWLTTAPLHVLGIEVL